MGGEETVENEKSEDGGRYARLQPMRDGGEKRALLSIGVRAGSGSERDDEKKGSPLYR